MNVNTNHLVNVEYDAPAPEGYDLLPERLNRGARRKLGKNNNAYVSKTSGGKLSRWAAKQRKIKNGINKKS